jgi:asparagine synthase (glutamine-hydrolysing)
LISDVPLGAFLSGGVDSSLVVAGMGPARTFSIGFDDPSYNELPWSERVAEHLGVSHKTEIIHPQIADLFQHLMLFMDDPIGDFSIFPTFLVSKVTRRDVTVALSGDGGDECFGGYETYVAQQMARSWSRIPGFVRRMAEPVIRSIRPTAKKKGTINKAKRFVEGLEHGEALEHARWRLFIGEALRRQLFTPEARRQIDGTVGDHILALQRDSKGLDELNRCLFVDLKSYLSDNCLVKVDRMSMAVSLESRVPLLDHELVELAFALPSELKVRSGKTKVLLKKVAARHVPADCVYRPKEGFSIPIKNWLGAELRPLMEELLDSKRVSADGLFDPTVVQRLKTEHLQGVANHSHILWSLVVFHDWQRRWLQ